MEHSVIRNLTVEQSTMFGRQLSLPAKLAIQSGIKNVEQANSFIIDFHPAKIPVVTFDQVNEKPNLLKGKIVLVGAMKEEQDCHFTPLGKMPGVELQAYSLLTLMKHKSIMQVPKLASLMIAIFLSYFYELFLEAIAIFVRTRKNKMKIFLSESRVLLTFFPMLFFSLVSIMGYLLFDIWSISVDMVIVLVMLSMVGFSRRLYLAFKKVFENDNESI